MKPRKAWKKIPETFDEIMDAYDFASSHMEKLKDDKVCGCFNCFQIFSPSEITEWIIEDNDCDRGGTALCPYCGIDTVIGEYSGYPITKEFLVRMSQFGRYLSD